MATYNLYSKINENALDSTARNLLSKVKESETNLLDLEKQFTTSVWKANAKQTLITALSQIDKEIYSKLQKQLQDIIKISSLIKTYKSNQSTAIKNKEYLNSANAKLNNSNYDQNSIKHSIENYKSIIAKCEIKMQEIEKTIKQII